MPENEKKVGSLEKISKFLLLDTTSLRNEIHFTTQHEMVHPLTFTHDEDKYPDLDLVPAMDKYQDEELKEKTLETLK